MVDEMPSRGTIQPTQPRPTEGDVVRLRGSLGLRSGALVCCAVDSRQFGAGMGAANTGTANMAAQTLNIAAIFITAE
jgi:hypothetical protein